MARAFCPSFLVINSIYNQLLFLSISHINENSGIVNPSFKKGARQNEKAK
jgi:hypothetical protein